MYIPRIKYFAVSLNRHKYSLGDIELKIFLKRIYQKYNIQISEVALCAR